LERELYRTALAMGMPSLAHAQPQCPNPPTVTISAQLPSDVYIPSGLGGNPIKFFDDRIAAMRWFPHSRTEAL